MNEYPEELVEFPRPVVALVGCIGLHSQIEKHLGTRKDLNGKEVCTYHILSMEVGSIIPERKKEKRQSYEGYTPMGILKANWIHKHKKQIPAFVVALFNWEDDKRTNEIANDIDFIKKNLKSRNIKLMIVLVTRQVMGEASSDERVSALKKRADLDSKYFLYFDKDNVAESVKRLEKIMSEHCRLYYKEEARRIKKDYQKTNLPKYTQQVLAVRHHFKIAYFAEFRKDNRTTLKYYNSAFNSLRELAIIEMKNNDKSKIVEIKTVADYINFQICKLYLFIGNINEAIGQFHKHIKTYKLAVGNTDVEFLHWSWVSKQYQVFGQLLELLVPSLSQTLDKHSLQHPGFYYQAAARYALDRKKHARRLCEPYRKSQNMEKYIKEAEQHKQISTDLTAQLYIGQPPLKVDLAHPLEAMDASKREQEDPSEALYRCIAEELVFDHSTLIIDLLTKAYEQYKSPKSSRMILYIASQMAHEYYAAEKYAIAKKFFDRIAKSYRKEGWFSLLTSILNISLLCAKQLGMTKDYIEYAIELIAPQSVNTLEEKKHIQNSVVTILANPASVGAQPLSEPFVIPMEQNHPLVSVKVQFTEEMVYANSKLTFLVRVKSAFPLPIRFNKLKVEFSDSAYNKEIEDLGDSNDTPDNLYFIPEQFKTFSFEMLSKQNLELKCTQLTLELYGVSFQWNVSEWPEKSTPIEGKNTFRERTKTRILQHEAKLEIALIHTQPALVNELYKLELQMKNIGDPIVKGTVSFEIEHASNDESKLLESDSKESQEVSEIALPAIDSNATHSHTVYFLASQETVHKKKLLVKVTYETSGNFTCAMEKAFEISVQTPFAYTFVFTSQQFNPHSPTSGHIVLNQPFFLSLEMQSNAPFPIQLLSSGLLLNTVNKETVADVISTTDVTESKQFTLSKENKFTLWYQISPTISGDVVELGEVELKWRRGVVVSLVIKRVNPKTNEYGSTTSTKLAIPQLKINTAPFTVKIDVPSFAVVGSVIPFSLVIHNHTDLLQEFNLSVIDNSYFLFSGDKQSTFSVHPHFSHTIKHNLLPLIAGRQPLPHFQITSKRLNKELPQTKQTRYIFINPSKEPSRYVK